MAAEQITSPVLRAMLAIASLVAVAGGAVTLYVIAVHDPDDGANIGGGIGLIGSGLAIAAVVVSISARGRSRGLQLAASICAGLLLLVALSFLLLIRPFE